MSPKDRKNLLAHIADLGDRYGAFAEEVEQTTRRSEQVLRRVNLKVKRSFEDRSILGNENEDGYAPSVPNIEPVSDVPIYDDTNDFQPATSMAENQVTKGEFGSVQAEESFQEHDHSSYKVPPRRAPNTNPPATPTKQVQSSPHLRKIYKTLAQSPGENLKIHEGQQAFGDELAAFNQSMEAPKDDFDDQEDEI